MAHPSTPTSTPRQVLAKGFALREGAALNGDSLFYGLLCSLFSSIVIGSIYPASGCGLGERGAACSHLNLNPSTPNP